MNRIEFVKNLFGKGLLLTLPVPKLPENKLTHSEVLIYASFVAGFQFYEGEKLIHKMKAGDEIDLVREPENEHDEFAIAVYWEGEKLGYLPRADNFILTNIIDANLPLTCNILETYPEEDLWEQCEIGVYLVYPSAFLQTFGIITP